MTLTDLIFLSRSGLLEIAAGNVLEPTAQTINAGLDRPDHARRAGGHSSNPDFRRYS
jgi:hypothetical protein